MNTELQIHEGIRKSIEETLVMLIEANANFDGVTDVREYNRVFLNYIVKCELTNGKASATVIAEATA